MIPFVVCGWVHHMLAALDPEGYPVTVATNPFTDLLTVGQNVVSFIQKLLG